MTHRKSRVNPVRFLGMKRLTILTETDGPLQRGIRVGFLSPFRDGARGNRRPGRSLAGCPGRRHCASDCLGKSRYGSAATAAGVLREIRKAFRNETVKVIKPVYPSTHPNGACSRWQMRCCEADELPAHFRGQHTSFRQSVAIGTLSHIRRLDKARARLKRRG